MKNRTAARALAATTATALAAGLGAVSAPAQAKGGGPKGERSLVAVLGADGNRLDKRWNDFDIAEKAVRAVLAEKKDSNVGLLADGSVALTAFLPTDRAFRKLVHEVTGERPRNERKTLKGVVKAFDIDTIETVLLYHVVPGATITYRKALQADGAALDTAAGAAIEVDVRGKRVSLVDADTDDPNARVRLGQRNINKGNKQIAHGINRVLRPVDLP